MKIKLFNEDGFSLLEVLTSMFIMAFSLMLLLHMAMVAVDGNSWASSTTTCTQLLQQKLEELRAENEPVSGEDTVDGILREWVVSDAGSHLREVSISATWVSPDSTVRSYAINSLIKTDAP
ncbi:MAG: prepilin-type N-terminal cleavage/methylation domain-containing protein [candidate division Zixibacteria bacterium]